MIFRFPHISRCSLSPIRHFVVLFHASSHLSIRIRAGLCGLRLDFDRGISMSIVSFLVGFTASGVASFAIVEMLADRRCLSFRRRSHEEFILSSIYKAVRLP